MCMSLTHSEVLIKEHTRMQQALVCDFPDPRQVFLWIFKLPKVFETYAGVTSLSAKPALVSVTAGAKIPCHLRSGRLIQAGQCGRCLGTYGHGPGMA